MPPSVPHEQKHLARPKYREDIDGLRAIAVLFVLGFHAFPEIFKGGYVGVDVFFVISGFLISGVIIGSLDEGSFSFREFYARRIKRIFPALFLVMAACIAFGWFVLTIDEYKQLGKHIAAGAGFLSNFFFWYEAGYFDNVSETKPLLHLWSLGIEEQFYIVWPFLLYLTRRSRLYFAVLTITLIVISFAINVSLRHSHPVEDFYSPITRFWELLIGGLLVVSTSPTAKFRHTALQKLPSWIGKFSAGKSRHEPLFRNAQSILGGLLIVLAVPLISRNTAFPGLWALLPTMGTFLAISAGQHAWLNRTILSRRMLVWVGLISFPLYLWHWPLLSFAHIIENNTPSNGIRIACLILATILAWISYQFVEKPIRFGKNSQTKVITLVLLMCALLGAGYATYREDGWNKRAWAQASLEMNNEMDYGSHWKDWSLCPNEGESEDCRILDTTREPTIEVIGDSHAGHLASGLAELFGSRGVNVTIRLSAGCIPFFEIEKEGNQYSSCKGNFVDRALNDAIRSTSIKTIILSNYALRMIQGNRGYTRDQPAIDRYVNNPSTDMVRRNSEIYEKAMNRTLSSLVKSGKKIIYLVDTPELYFDPKECVSFRPFVLHGHKTRKFCTIDRAKFEKRNADYHRIIVEAKAVFPEVKFIDMYEYFCDDKQCHGMIDGKLLYQSRDHITPTGSRYLVRKMAGELLD